MSCIRLIFNSEGETMPELQKIEDIRRAHIIETTLIAISEKGAANLTMRDIAKAAGLSNGGIAHYFKTKEEIFKAAFKEFFDRIFVRSREELMQYDDPMEKLLGFGAFFDENEPEIIFGYPLMFDCMAIAVHNEDYRQLFEQWLEGWVSQLREAIIEGVNQNIFQDIDADAVARVISTIYQGMSIRWYLARESHSTEWAMASFQESIKSIMAPYRV